MESPSEDPKDWDRIQTLFAEALERSPEERASFLDRACAGDPPLRAEIDSLLAAHRHAGAFMTGHGREHLPDLPTLASLEGRLVGPWRVLRLLGRGGMGAVYLAERADGEYEREVALKVVKRGMDTDAILGRFIKERQILAGLDHPGIARFLDAGSTSDGLPYFVMERIEGESLLRYCDARGLGVEARLRLFCDVCRAIQYAHNNLVVHRDIKPSNILVTAEGRVKLLDFGIAKVLGGEGAAEHTALTVQGMRPVTPEYAAPEQLRGEPVTTAADVYGLGAVLYELVAGRTPHGFGRRSLEEASRAVPNDEPIPPSRAVADREASEGRTSPAGRRRLARRLRGDLDTIILTALRSEPERRYPTAEAMLEDLRRFLAGRPISARPDTAIYRTSTFIRRHRVGVMVTGGVLGMLLGSGVALFLQQRQTVLERDRAELRAAEAQEVADFLVALFQAADPQREPGTYSARELLDRGAERLEGGLGGQPLTRAHLLETIASAYHELRLLEPATRLFEEAVQLRERAQGPAHPDLAPPLLGLAAAHLHAVRYAEAEHTLARAQAIAGAMPGPESPALLRSLILQGNLHLARGSPAAAEETYRRALGVAERLETGPQQADVLNNLAVAVEEQGRLDEAQALHERAMEIRRTELGPGHPAVGQSLLNLGRLALARDEAARAEEILDRALELREGALGPDHTAVAEVLALRAEARLRQGWPDAAVGDLRHALRLREERLGPEHPETARTRFELARMLAQKGGDQVREAVTLAEAAVAVLREVEGLPHSDLALAEDFLADLRERSAGPPPR